MSKFKGFNCVGSIFASEIEQMTDYSIVIQKAPADMNSYIADYTGKFRITVEVDDDLSKAPEPVKTEEKEQYNSMPKEDVSESESTAVPENDNVVPRILKPRNQI